MRIEKFWVITMPGSESTLEDILFETNAKGLELQFRGGLEVEKIHALYTEKEEASIEAQRVLTASKKYYRAFKIGKSSGKSRGL